MSKSKLDRRTLVDCGRCGNTFMRSKNARHCSDACRLLAKVSVDSNGCWIWQAARNRRGYGTFTHDGRKQSAYRVAYELFRGPIPSGLHLDHLCRNRGCVNPKHLEPVTGAENSRRGAVARTHCKHNHEFTADNTYVRPDGARQCRACNAAAARRYYAARAALAAVMAA